jgi:DNA-binding MarR family transcriptional regulator/DNA-binding response OmpR family regulator
MFSSDALQDDELILVQDDEVLPSAPPSASSSSNQRWKILIVDDDVEVHEVTQLSLSDVTFEHKSLTFLSAYSAQEARQLIQAHPDIAILFLDVVMETDSAGLEVIRYIREELGNLAVRIIVRTGQPGQAPEAVVAANYGIDDYKTKTELTSEKLFIVVVTALRAFSTITQMLELSQSLKLELSQYQQPESAVERGETKGEDGLLGRTLGAQRSPIALIHPQPQANPREKLETLSQWITEVTQDIMQSSSASTLYTIHTITRIARMVLRITDEHSAKLGLSQSKLATLMYLSNEAEQSASPSALAKHCGISRPAMTGLLNGLEQEGYVSRDEHPFDRRALTVKLTAKGQQFLEWIAPQDSDQLSELVASEEIERRDLIQLAQKVLKLLQEQVIHESID